MSDKLRELVAKWRKLGEENQQRGERGSFVAKAQWTCADELEAALLVPAEHTVYRFTQKRLREVIEPYLPKGKLNWQILTQLLNVEIEVYSRTTTHVSPRNNMSESPRLDLNKMLNLAAGKSETTVESAPAAVPAERPADEEICCEQCGEEITNKTYLCTNCWNRVAPKAIRYDELMSAERPQLSRREQYHEAIEKVLEMRKYDLAQSKRVPAQQEYYFGRAHRCDDILFWLGHIEANIPAGGSTFVAGDYLRKGTSAPGAPKEENT